MTKRQEQLSISGTEPVEIGKRKHVVADKTPKAKTINAPIASDKGRRGREKDVDLDTPKTDESVEMRRVSRKSVAAEIDGFATVRASMNGGETVQ